MLCLHSTSEDESVPPLDEPLIKQQTSQSFWVLGEDGADVRDHTRAAAAAETLHRQIQTSTSHSRGAYKSSVFVPVCYTWF